MKRQVIRLLAVVLVALGIGAFFLARERADSGYRASDPALVAATGRPQLVEFYHRA